MVQFVKLILIMNFFKNMDSYIELIKSQLNNNKNKKDKLFSIKLSKKSMKLKIQKHYYQNIQNQFNILLSLLKNNKFNTLLEIIESLVNGVMNLFS